MNDGDPTEPEYVELAWRRDELQRELERLLDRASRAYEYQGRVRQAHIARVAELSAEIAAIDMIDSTEASYR